MILKPIANTDRITPWDVDLNSGNGYLIGRGAGVPYGDGCHASGHSLFIAISKILASNTSHGNSPHPSGINGLSNASSSAVTRHKSAPMEFGPRYICVNRHTKTV